MCEDDDDDNNGEEMSRHPPNNAIEMTHLPSNLNRSTEVSDEDLAWLIDSKDEESISDSHSKVASDPIFWHPQVFSPSQHPLRLMVGLII